MRYVPTTVSAGRKTMSFLEALAQGPIVFDGAMGTLLYERGVFLNQNFDEICLSRPEVVRKAHADHARAGAQVIETNTFGANRFRLRTHGFEDKVQAINHAAARIAREAVGEDVWVAGSVGRTGVVPGVAAAGEMDAVGDAFREQIAALAEGGVDLLIIETFRHIEEIRIAIQAAREVSKLPIIAQVTFDAECRLADGTTPERAAVLLRDWGAAVIGTNCGEGPVTVYDAAERMLGVGVPVSAQANAGIPRLVEGRLIYMSTPEYFGVFARRLFKRGVQIVGGCCGTTPEHVKRIAAAARMMGSEQPDPARAPIVTAVAGPTRLDPVPLDKRSPFGAKLGKKFVVSVEINPPPGLDATKEIEAAKRLVRAGVDVINTSDGPRATARFSNLAFALMLQRDVGIDPLLHVACRDRNLLGMLSHVLGAHVLGLRNLVVITGDPPKMGDYPEATAVYDLDSVGLLQMVNNLNRGIDPAGKPLGNQAQTAFVCATGAEPNALDFDREMQRLKRKRDAGADLVMTQPVYDIALVERFLTNARPLGLPILIGLLPLVSYRNAEFLHHEVPGMQVPEQIRERMRKAGSGAEARKEGARIAREMLAALKSKVDGAYIMPQLGHYDLALEVLEGL